MPSPAADELDLRLLHALQIDGRAAFSRIAGVLGVSDQTVARRYARLRTHGGLRVIGVTDETRIGRSRWYLRLRCTPDAAEPLAGALARRPDTSWIGLTSGGTEVLCMMAARSRDDRDTLLLDKLQRTPRVTAVSAHLLLHTFYGGPLGWFSKSEVLAPEQIAALTLPPVVPQEEPVLLDGADERLLAALGREGRTPVVELCKATGQSESAVRRRLEQLRRNGVLFMDVQFDTGLIGQETKATLWLTVTPSALATAGAALAEHREIVFAAATTGPSNIVAVAVCRDTAGLYRYLSERIGALDGVQQVETAPLLRQVKQLTCEGPVR